MHVTTLRVIKMAHTIVWALFVMAIVSIPVAAWLEWWTVALALIALVTVECLVLAFNHMRCPLTAVAARYTSDRRDNFDIYLPLWLARYNKHIFGTLFAAAVVFTVWRWRL